MPLLKRLIKILFGLVVAGTLLLLGLLIFLWVQHNRTVILPIPTGPYSVGRIGYDWVDPTRTETLSNMPNKQRELMVWVWYPAAPPAPGTPSAPYLPPNWAQARSSDSGLSALLTQRLASVHGHAVADAAVAPAQQPYPVLILQPGLGPIVTDYTSLAEELASHGYIVVGSTPTYSANIVVFADGRIAQRTSSGNPPDSASPEASKRMLDRLIGVWAGDDRFVLNQLNKLQSADPAGKLTGRLDLEDVGVLGHSFGGATAAEVCHLDPRCKAGVNLDGYLFGDVVQQGLSQPFMFIWSQPPDKLDTTAQQAARDVQTLYSKLPHGGYQITIKGARHFNFADYAVLDAPVLKMLGYLGPIDGRRGLKMSGDYVRAFFDRYLKGIDTPLLNGPSPAYPEVQFEAR